MSTPPPGQPSEEELRAAYEAEIKKLRVEDVVIQTVVSLVNLAGRKAGLAPGTEDERDLDQLRVAIEASRALLPLVEEELGPDATQVRNALSQLQVAYAQGAGEGGGPGETPPSPGGPAQQGGAGEPQQPQQPPASRLWVPGQ
jgi:hypothetical protein